MRVCKYDELKGLKKVLKKHNIHYKDMAERMGLSINGFNSKLNGYAPITLNEVKFIIKELGIDNPQDIMRIFFNDL